MNSNQITRRGSLLVSAALALQIFLVTPAQAQPSPDPIAALIATLTQLLLEGGVSQQTVNQLIADLQGVVQANQALQAQLVQTLCASGHYLDGDGNCTAAAALVALSNSNTAAGEGALQSNTSGAENTASGADALGSNTTGNRNTASGREALFGNTTGANNTASGAYALLANTTSGNNTANGAYALTNSTGGSNTASGFSALLDNTTGSNNTASGASALQSNTTGGSNTASGFAALLANTTGSGNIGIGSGAGANNATGSNNIYIGNNGADESITTRIGTNQTRAFIAGIVGTTTDMVDAITVVIDSDGQLGTVSSSRRYKQDIRDMGDASGALLALRPVTFRYKSNVQSGERPQEYGLIAEEVAEAFPDLVVYGKDGEPETVKYRLLSSLLLNEVQKQDALNQAQQRRFDTVEHFIREQRRLIEVRDAENRALRERLAKLEAALSMQVASRN